MEVQGTLNRGRPNAVSPAAAMGRDLDGTEVINK